MKTLILTLIVALVLMTSVSSWAYVQVRGYIRSNGTYVAPHIRSNPDGNPYNNLSSFNMTGSSLKGTPFNPDAENKFLSV